MIREQTDRHQLRLIYTRLAWPAAPFSSRRSAYSVTPFAVARSTGRSASRLGGILLHGEREGGGGRNRQTCIAWRQGAVRYVERLIHSCFFDSCSDSVLTFRFLLDGLLFRSMLAFLFLQVSRSCTYPRATLEGLFVDSPAPVDRKMLPHYHAHRT